MQSSVVLDELVSLWHEVSSTPTGMGLAAPDRTAIKRLIEAVEAGLAQLPEGTARLSHPPRAKTVGPWRLVCASGVQWQLAPQRAVGPFAGTREAPSPDLPTLLAEAARNPVAITALLGLVNQFTLADDALRRGEYTDSALLWQTMLNELALSTCGQTLVGLRLVRALRRGGQFSQAHPVLKQAALQARATAGRAGDSLRAECALLAARLRFDVARVEAARELDFGQLWRHTQQSLSPSLQAQWANLHALVVRRRLLALHEAGAPLAERVAVHLHQLALYEAAIFWLLEDGDAYNLQAVVINLANYLNGVQVWLKPTDQARADWFEASLTAFALGHTLLDRFDLPQDSAWDFIMLGELYMGTPEVRAWLHANPLAWPGQQSPAHEGFYRKSIEVAVACGDQRQIIVAWDQLARWRLTFGQPEQATHAAAMVRELLQQDAKLASDLARDGFAPVPAPPVADSPSTEI
ncbi:MAG: hypothetical protein LCH89_09330 [Proteobacteria bacterium]|nr:hypothetical protein [Pseudomonadota bacterium]